MLTSGKILFFVIIRNKHFTVNVMQPVDFTNRENNSKTQILKTGITFYLEENNHKVIFLIEQMIYLMISNRFLPGGKLVMWIGGGPQNLPYEDQIYYLSEIANVLRGNLTIILL